MSEVEARPHEVIRPHQETDHEAVVEPRHRVSLDGDSRTCC